MPKRELAPQVGRISKAEYRDIKRLIKYLAIMRLGWGKSTLSDNSGKKLRYPREISGPALNIAEQEAKKLGLILDLSIAEKNLKAEIYKLVAFVFGFCFFFYFIDMSGDGTPDMYELLYHLLDPKPTGLVRTSDTLCHQPSCPCLTCCSWLANILMTRTPRSNRTS